MKYCTSEPLVLLMLLVSWSIALPLSEIKNGERNSDNFGPNGCREICGENKICDDREHICICKKGYRKVELDSEDCEEDICTPGCDPETQYCEESQCICKDGYLNEGEPGSTYCLKPTERATKPSTAITSSHSTHNTTITSFPTTHNITTTISPSTRNTTTTHFHPTHNTTTTHSHPTHNTTTTTLKPVTTTSKPKPKPTHKPHKTGMSPWTITGIIILVAGLAGLGGYTIYRKKNRGSYRTTTST